MIPNDVIIIICQYMTGTDYYLINKYIYEVITKYEKSQYWYDLYSKIICKKKVQKLSLKFKHNHFKYNWKQEHIRISKSKITTEWFILNDTTPPKYIKQLFLINQQIGFLPKEIRKLTSLEGMYLSSNNITCIPKEIIYLKNLRTINFSNNKIKIIPKEIGELILLEEIDFSFNQIKEIPSEISNLINLKFVILNNNLVENVPKELSKLYRKKIQQIHLQNNNISKLPAELNNLVNFNIIYT